LKLLAAGCVALAIPAGHSTSWQSSKWIRSQSTVEAVEGVPLVAQRERLGSCPTFDGSPVADVGLEGEHTVRNDYIV
jgi:hypothetical protein